MQKFRRRGECRELEICLVCTEQPLFSLAITLYSDGPALTSTLFLASLGLESCLYSHLYRGSPLVGQGPHLYPEFLTMAWYIASVQLMFAD